MDLYRFARGQNGSARLRNSLEAAALGGQLPFATVAEYLASPAPVETMMLRVGGLGRKTALELDQLVRTNVSVDGSDAEAGLPSEQGTSEGVATIRNDLAGASLRDLIARASPGTRLERALRCAVGDRPALDALDDADAVRCDLLCAETAGAVTADEFCAKIHLATSRLLREMGGSPSMHDAVLTALFGKGAGPVWPREARLQLADEEAHKLLRNVLGEAGCASAFEDAIVPVRLTRLIRARNIGDRPIADALVDRTRFGWELGRVQAVGRKTISEFWDVLWRRLAVHLARAEVGATERGNLARFLEVELTRLDPNPEDMAEHAPLVPSSEDAADRVLIPRGLDELLAFMLERIRPQDAPIVRRRFGLDGPPETLEEIGVSLKVTRERIRQIEKRGLGDLKVLARKVSLRQALDERWGSAWDALADGDDLITDLEFATFRKMVPGAIILGLELLGLDLASWLTEVAHRYPHGWLSPSRERAPVDDALGALRDVTTGPPLPRALGELGLPGAPLDVEAAVLVGAGFRTLHGYVVEGRIGTRRKRSLVTHAVLAGFGKPMTLSDLQRAYRQAAPADQCSTRDLTIVMSDAPHLFLEVSEWRWTAVGGAGEIPPRGRRRDLDEVDEGLGEGDLTVASAIRDELERVGPQPLSALTDNPRRYLPPDRSHNSVQPTLLTRPDLFARLLPGVYSLWSQVPTREVILSGEMPYLLDEQQAKIFAMARRADEPWGTFPLWSPDAEYRLCRWAIRKGSGEVRRSLLATATVDAWPVEIEERDEWRAVCAREGRYDLVANVRPNVFAVRPDLDRLLAALIDLEASGRTSWMALNRVDGRHVASQMGCGLLAVLLLSGALTPLGQDAESAWQLTHAIETAAAAKMRGELAAELHERGRLDWASEVGARIAERIVDGEERAAQWIPFRRFSALFRDLATAPSKPIEITLEVASDVGRALLAERRKSDLLAWLDGN
jgi:hypothetical protein